jgi:hypothetical protein
LIHWLREEASGVVEVRRAISGLVAAGLLASATSLGSASSAAAETVTRTGVVSVTPGWTSAVFDRDALVLPFTFTAPCDLHDYGSGITLTLCDSIRVDLVNPSTPEAIDSTTGLPHDDGTGANSLAIYGFALRGFGTHTLRATDTDTGETTTTTVTLKALTRTGVSAARTRKAPASATLTVSATLTAFAGYGFSPLTGSNQLVLQRLSGTTWTTIGTAVAASGSASWRIAVKASGSYRVCHWADAYTTASCTSARTL